MQAPENTADVIYKQRTEDISWRVIDDEVIVLDLKSAAYLRLNKTSALLWDELEAGASISGLGDFLVERFDIDREVALKDALAFIDLCKSQNLLEQ